MVKRLSVLYKVETMELCAIVLAERMPENSALPEGFSQIVIEKDAEKLYEIISPVMCK